MMRSLIIFLAGLWIFPCANGQSLDSLFGVAAGQNPGLMARYKEFEAAMENLSQVGVLPDPMISLGYFVLPVETRLGPQQARISLSQRFPWFGTLKAQKDKAALLAEARYQVFLEARNRLYYQVAAAYYPLLELEEVRRIEKENLRLLVTFKSLATAGFAAGKGDMTDVLRVELMENDTRTRLDILEKNERQLRARLNQLLGRNPDDLLVVTDSLRLPPGSAPREMDSILSKNPVLAGLDLQIEAAEVSHVVTDKMGMPQIGAGIDYVMVGRREDAAPAGNGRDVLMPMVSLSIPVFRGQYRSAHREAELKTESLHLQKEDYTNSLLGDYETTRLELEKQAEWIRLYDAQLTGTRRLLDLLLVAYRNSGRDFEEVLRMEQTRLQYEKARVSAMSNYLITLAKLDYLTTNF